MSEGSLDLARSEFLPKLVFITDYSYMAMKNDMRFSGDDFSKGFSSSLTLQFPVFSGLKSRADYEQASLEINIARHHEKQIRDAVAAEVEFAHNKLRETDEKVLATLRAVELSTEAYRLARVMYDEGANTQLDVLTARVNLTQAQVNLANVLFEYHVARYLVRKATGTLEGVLS
jgi:outer membrane protein TolC